MILILWFSALVATGCAAIAYGTVEQDMVGAATLDKMLVGTSEYTYSDGASEYVYAAVSMFKWAKPPDERYRKPEREVETDNNKQKPHLGASFICQYHRSAAGGKDKKHNKQKKKKKKKEKRHKKEVVAGLQCTVCGGYSGECRTTRAPPLRMKKEVLSTTGTCCGFSLCVCANRHNLSTNCVSQLDQTGLTTSLAHPIGAMVCADACFDHLTAEVCGSPRQASVKIVM